MLLYCSHSLLFTLSLICGQTYALHLDEVKDDTIAQMSLDEGHKDVKNHNQQCEMLWGSGAKKADDSCFDLNTDRSADMWSGCGKNSNGVYIKCAPKDKLCGKIHCTRKVANVSLPYFPRGKPGRRGKRKMIVGGTMCIQARLPLRNNADDPTMTASGIKCGENSVCVNHKCIDLSTSDGKLNEARCGNGVVEKGETCDCGTEDECRASNAIECCDHKTCSLKAQDGSPCDNGESYCFKGGCKSHNQQCEMLWGPGAKKADNWCFDLNTRRSGKWSGCGKDSNGVFIKCTSEDKLCGKLQCTTKRARMKLPNLPIIGSYRGKRTLSNGGITCIQARLYVRNKADDPTMTASGTKCGENSVCVNHKCIDFSTSDKK